MNPPTYSQPDPYPQGVPTTPVARPEPQPNRKFIPVVAGVVLAIVAFAGGFAVANATASNTGTGGNANFGGDANGQGFPGASGRLRNGNGFGGGASGTVSSVAADQMTITTQSGGSRIVLLTRTTTVTEVTSTPKTTSDIASGTTVTVVGSSNPDGSVTATQVIIGDAGVFGRGPGGGGNNGAPAPSTAP